METESIEIAADVFRKQCSVQSLMSLKRHTGVKPKTPVLLILLAEMCDVSFILRCFKRFGVFDGVRNSYIGVRHAGCRLFGQGSPAIACSHRVCGQNVRPVMLLALGA